ncbi:DUF2194 domain-containing protein [Streptococcus sp. NLN76]|uniref:DUF2194 domain-containing protein n=1 Tax=Streptococcus sp. NLN76 TaxID=2822800 RepID=UPI0018AC7E50|nr:DUF2194 domain-containing protein [Streptococcus sp. NLN76]MBF8969612.1 DUF2194 domain-containing protein [Streptococcus sp. NLN76]
MKKLRWGMQLLFLVLASMCLFLMYRAQSYQALPRSRQHPFVKTEVIQDRRGLQQGKVEGLLLYHSKNPSSLEAQLELEHLLKDFRKSARTVDLAHEFLPESLEDYQTIYYVGEDLLQKEELQQPLKAWVEAGGHLYIGMPQASEEDSSFQRWLGVEPGISGNQVVSSISLEKDLMIGGSGPFAISHPFDSAWDVSLDASCRVPVWDTETKTPLLWSKEAGKGQVVVMNLGIYDKVYRAIYGLGLSLMDPIFLYPVINAGVVYLDDFPAPFSDQEKVQLSKHRQENFDQFVTQTWWPAIQVLGKDLDLTYTGAIVASYGEQVTSPFPLVLPELGTLELGRMLLKQGGALAYHGYNHQPLQIHSGSKDYLPWSQEWAIRDSLQTLEKLVTTYYGAQKPVVYVPPSNILSREGRSVLATALPDLKGIASTYFPGDGAYAQEFDLGSDGLLNLPRLVSGMDWDDFDRLAVFSELNTHLVHSQFIHPDDVLDNRRSHGKTWEELLESYRSSMKGLQKAVPDLDFVGAGRFADKVGAFLNVTLQVEEGSDFLELKLDHVQGNSSFLFRQNKGRNLRVTGGKIKRLAKRLYLLETDEEKVRIEWDQ